jgi:hypothetical protein
MSPEPRFDLPASIVPIADAVFERFTPQPVELPTGFKADSFLGTRYCPDFDATRTDDGVPWPPKADEEYFEWLSLLAAALEAPDVLTFVEAGAGYGRWSIRAAAAARALGKPYRLVCVEAEPTHFGWMVQTLKDNDIDPANHHIHFAAVAGQSGEVEMLTGAGRWRPESWWGQFANQPHVGGIHAWGIRQLRNCKRRLQGIRTVVVPAISLQDAHEGSPTAHRHPRP